MTELSEPNLPLTFKDFRKKAEELEKSPTPTISFDDFDSKVDKDFSEFRKKFDDEIQKVEAEMARFRSELMDKDGNFLLSALLAKKPNRSSSPEGEKLLEDSSDSQPYLPKRTKKRVKKLRSDIRKPKTDETGNKKLSAQAKHQQKKSQEKSIDVEPSKDDPLPDEVKPDAIRSILNHNNLLTAGTLPDLPKPRKSVAFK